MSWYETWEDTRGPNAPPAVWKEFIEAFLDHFLSLEIRQAKVDEFVVLRQNDMSMKEYNLKFTSLARYAP